MSMTNFPQSATSGGRAKKWRNFWQYSDPTTINKFDTKKSRSKCQSLKQTGLPQMAWLSPRIHFEIWGWVVSEKLVADSDWTGLAVG